MNLKSSLLILMALAAGSCVAAESPAKPGAPVEVNFVESQKFSDIKADHLNAEKGRAYVLVRLQKHLETDAARYVAPGQHLVIKVTDIDLAGDYEMWHGSEMMDVRIMKEVYPPRINLEFRLTDASGRELQAGRRQLRNVGFLATTTMFADDPLRYDKQLLSDWLRGEFKKPS
jgi:hypothetical protein